jgi:2-iminoacetate synthase
MSTGSSGNADWSRDQIQKRAAQICDPAVVEAHLRAGEQMHSGAVHEVLYKGRAGEGLSPSEAAALLTAQQAGLREEILDAAQDLHERLFGRRISLFAPVCPTNRCVNDCFYCPLRRSNSRLRRHTDSVLDVQRETAALLDEGYRDLMLVFGEDRGGVPYARDAIWAAYGARSGLRRLERVDVNLNPLSAGEIADLSAGLRLGINHVFQETYHPTTYAAVHPDGPKADYAWRLTAHDRALEAGWQQAGLGILLGLYDYRFDLVALLRHAQHLDMAYGCSLMSITYPRLIPAPEAPASRQATCEIRDEDLSLIVAVTRLARPQAEIILSTPVERFSRRALYARGISRVSVGSLSYPGVYTEGSEANGGRLSIGRPRALEELVYRMCEADFIPDFSLACGNLGAEEASLGAADLDRCLPNALLALKEYLMDHASPDTQTMGNRLIQKQLGRLPERLRSATLELMEEAEAGLRRLSL